MGFDLKSAFGRHGLHRRIAGLDYCAVGVDGEIHDFARDRSNQIKPRHPLPR